MAVFPPTSQSLPCSLSEAPRTYEPDPSRNGDHNYLFHSLGTRILGSPLNSGTMTDVTTLASALLANFVTVRLPRFEPPQPEREGLPSTRAIQRLVAALRTDWLSIQCHLLRIRCELAEHGYMRFFDRIEADSHRGWRIHFFCLDEEAVSVIAGLSGQSCGPGSAVRFDPQVFVLARLGNLQRWGKLERQYPWWDTDVE